MAKSSHGRVSASRKRKAPATSNPAKPLSDPKREVFAQEIAAGVELYQAFEAAGFKRPAGNAQAMRRESDVTARIDWLIARVEPLDDAVREYRRAQLDKRLTNISIADRAEMFEEIEIKRVVGRGRNKQTIVRRILQLKPLAKLSAAHRALIEGIDANGLPTMPGKLGADAQLARLHGFDKPLKIAPTNPQGDGPVLVQWMETPAATSSEGQAA